MSELKGSARKYLRGLAHSLRPVVQIGKDGLTDAVVGSVEDALSVQELIKVQFVGSRESKDEIIAAVEERTGSTCVGRIGHMAILYREHPDQDRRRIVLPR